MIRQGKTKRETFPILTSLDDKIHYNFAWYHIYSKNNEQFLRFNVLHHVCLLIKNDNLNRIELPNDKFVRFENKYYEFKELEPLVKYQEGVVCSYCGLISWIEWGRLKNKYLQYLNPLCAELEVYILDGINKIKLTDLIKEYGKDKDDWELGTFEQHQQELEDNEEGS